jgi:hypothetical protein
MPALSPSKKKFILYPNAPWYFALAIVVTMVGFSKSYFGNLGQISIFHHIHGATATAWMLLLILQPILYKQGKLALHRKLGWIAAFTLVPMLMIGGLIMMHLMVGPNAKLYPPGIPYQLSYIDCCSLIMFPLFFILSLKHGRNIHLHARYMACTVLTVLPPAITRVLFLIPWFDSFNKTLNGSYFAVELVFLLLIIDDKRSGNIRKPYLVALLIFTALHISMNFAGNWHWWQQTMDKYGAFHF